MLKRGKTAFLLIFLAKMIVQASVIWSMTDTLDHKENETTGLLRIIWELSNKKAILKLPISVTRKSEAKIIVRSQQGKFVTTLQVRGHKTQSKNVAEENIKAFSVKYLY